MEERAPGPVGSEVVPAKSHAFAVYGVDHLLRVLEHLSSRHQTPQLLVAGSVKKNPKSIFAVLKEIRRSSANHDGIAFARDFGSDPFHHRDQTISIKEFVVIERYGSLITTPPENLG